MTVLQWQDKISGEIVMLSQGHHRLEASLCWCNISQLTPGDSVKANINPPVQEGVVGIANDAFGKPSRRQLSYMGCCEWVWSNIKKDLVLPH